MRSALRWIGTAVLAIVIVVPAVGLATVLTTRSGQIEELERPPTPLIVEGTEISVDGSRNATLVIRSGPRPEVLSSGAAGRITAVFVGVGDRIRTGDIVYEVDGIGRIATVSERPFYRTLSLGDSGDDVVALKTLLRTAGIDVESRDDRYDRETSVAVRELRADLGEVNPPNSFSPELAVWLPTPELQVQEIVIRAGAAAPALGDLLMRGPAPILSATVQTADRQTLPDDLIGGPVIDAATGVELATIADTSGALAMTPAVTGTLSSLLAERPTESTSLDALEVDVVVQRAEPVIRLVVPASAVMTDVAGSSTCVWLETSEGWGALPVQIEAVDELASVGVAAGALTPTDRLLANPTEILSSPACPSS